jgi:hypothetical protein
MVRELMNCGATLLRLDLEFDDLRSEHDLFVEMLNREFPSGVRIENSSLSVPQSASTRPRADSPYGKNLPRKCGISESESKPPCLFNSFIEVQKVQLI